MKELEKKILVCNKCPLGSTRKHGVPGEGSLAADIMFVGEAPGQKEDELGRPFVGAAGKLLDKLIESIGLKRQDVYIANVIKCRPPENRDPFPEEIEACRPWLDQQIDLIKPMLIVLLGRHAMGRFLPDPHISVDHGKPKRRHGRVYYPVYHPAAALYRRQLLEDLQKDFKRIPRILKMIKEGRLEKDSREKQAKEEQKDLGI